MRMEAAVSALTDFRGEESRRRVSRLRCFWDAGTGSQDLLPAGGLCCHPVAAAGRATWPAPQLSVEPRCWDLAVNTTKGRPGSPGAWGPVGKAGRNLHLPG